MQWRCRHRTIDLTRPVVMGILNVTPDSFSDGNRYATVDAALERAARIAEEGAAIIDVGGESTRPGAQGVDEEVEIASPGRMSRVGLINDDSTPVGQVHLGVVHLFELERPLVKAREEGLAEAGFVPLATLATIRHEFETWSQICIASIF